MLKDRFDKEITVGCTVAYPCRQGSACWINTGTVTQIITEPPEGYPPSYQWQPRLRLTGGRHQWRWAGSSKELGTRTIRWSDNVLVVG